MHVIQYQEEGTETRKDSASLFSAVHPQLVQQSGLIYGSLLTTQFSLLQQLNKRTCKHNSQLVSPLLWRRALNTLHFYGIYSKWNQEILVEGVLIFPINCHVPGFQERLEGHGGLVLVSARDHRILFLLLTKVLTLTLQENRFFMSYIPDDPTEYYYYFCPSESKAQVPPSPANTSLDHNHYFL